MSPDLERPALRRKYYNYSQSGQEARSTCTACRCCLPIDTNEINFVNNVVLEREIGYGGFCSVFQATSGGCRVAMKVPHTRNHSSLWDSNSDEFDAVQLLQEYRILRKLRHPNIIAVYGCSLEPPMMAMELHTGRTLSKAIREEEGFMENWSVKLKLAKDVASGMQYWHSRGDLHCHGDLKSPNVLISATGDGIIIDATLAKCKASTTQLCPAEMLNLSPHAPEVIGYNSCGEKSDVYSMGMILWELLTGVDPFGEMPTHIHEQIAHIYNLEQRILRERMRPEIPEDLTSVPGYHPSLEQYVDLILSCWADYLDDRPTFAEINDQLSAIQNAMLSRNVEESAPSREFKTRVVGMYTLLSFLVMCFISGSVFWASENWFYVLSGLVRCFAGWSQMLSISFEAMAIFLGVIFLVCFSHLRGFKITKMGQRTELERLLIGDCLNPRYDQNRLAGQSAFAHPPPFQECHEDFLGDSGIDEHPYDVISSATSDDDSVDSQNRDAIVRGLRHSEYFLVSHDERNGTPDLEASLFRCKSI